MAKVNVDISDLWFNHNHSGYLLKDANGKFAGYDEAKRVDEATLFLAGLDRLGVVTPTPQELLADFDARV